MAKIELHERFFGDGLVGSIDLPRQPALSWSEHNALMAGAASALLAEQHARRSLVALAQLGLSVAQMSRALDRLEHSISLRLEAQTVLLARQVDLLADVADALRTPAKTRAAERLVDVGELLRRERWKLARDVAEEAISGDPNNPAGFLAATWACLGLKDIVAARDHALEAAAASDGVQRSRCGRQAARLMLAIDKPSAALATVERFGTREVQQTSGPASADEAAWRARLDAWLESTVEKCAVDYDRCVYLCVLNRPDAALEVFEDLATTDGAFCLAALADPFLVDHVAIQELARARLRHAKARSARIRARISEAIADAEPLSDTAYATLDGVLPADEQLAAGASINALQLEFAAVRQRTDELGDELALSQPLAIYYAARAERAQRALKRLATSLGERRAAKLERDKADVERRVLQDFAKEWARQNRAVVASGTDGAWYGYKGGGRRGFGLSRVFWRLVTGSDGLPREERYDGPEADLPAELLAAIQ